MQLIDSLNQVNILLVEDQHITRKLIKGHFDSDKYLFTDALNGYQALEAVESDAKYDLVILDIMLPLINGYEVCRKIREKFSLFELPIIFLTAKNLIDEIVEGFDAGANDYLTKPFDQSELWARSNTLIRLKKLTEANETMRAALDMKNKIVQMAVHDLKNPITTILSLSKLLQDDIKEYGGPSDILEVVVNSSESMLELVDEMLEASKIETGRISLKRESVDAYDLANMSIYNFNEKAALKGQTIELINKLESKCGIYADLPLLRRALDNLISNAIKYSPFEKKIEIIISEIIRDRKHKILFEITDEGPGLCDDDLSKMFGRFQKLTPRPTGGESSSGLGLSIAKDLVELHGGRIWAESVQGEGASFFIELDRYFME
ncbi:MAG: hypothetical protein QG635_286 [Bacteroidota bacterium]|nr:hypothetical protein [Bacteroidota bacterium]